MEREARREGTARVQLVIRGPCTCAGGPGRKEISIAPAPAWGGGGDSASSSVVKTRNYDESYEEDGTTSAMISVCLVRRVTVFYR